MTGYRTPRALMAGVVSSIITLRPRSFAADARRAIGSLRPRALIEGAGHIPPTGPFLVVHNHYNAPGYISWWNAFIISAAIAGRRAPGGTYEVAWIITAAWRGSGAGWRDRLLERSSRWAFRRVARIYGFLTMPPMPPHPNEAAERAQSVLQAVRLARSLAKSGGILGLTPEGQDHPGGFGPPPPGLGEFVALLVEAGLPVLPCGISQSSGQLCVRFGPLFTPDVPPRRANRDEIVARQVMDAIGACLERA